MIKWIFYYRSDRPDIVHININRIIDRAPMRALQTPQLFWREVITNLHQHYANDPTYTDDCVTSKSDSIPLHRPVTLVTPSRSTKVHGCSSKKVP